MFAFGPSGKSESFYDKYKDTKDIPKWLTENGLTAYEYPFTKLLTIGQRKAEEMGAEVLKYGIQLSLHAPYSISLSDFDEDITRRSIEDIFKAMLICKWMCGDRVVFHLGSISKEGRDAQFQRVKENMDIILEQYHKLNFKGIYLCPEVMGRVSHLGTIDEVIALANTAEEIIPTFDFAHIHARYGGLLKVEEDYRKVVDLIVKNLNKNKLDKLHIHFTKVEFGSKGEKRHRSYAEEAFGPDFAPLAKLLIEYKLSGRVISESRGTMLEDSVTLKEIYQRFAQT